MSGETGYFGFNPLENDGGPPKVELFSEPYLRDIQAWLSVGAEINTVNGDMLDREGLRRALNKDMCRFYNIVAARLYADTNEPHTFTLLDGMVAFRGVLGKIRAVTIDEERLMLAGFCRSRITYKTAWHSGVPEAEGPHATQFDFSDEDIRRAVLYVPILDMTSAEASRIKVSYNLDRLDEPQSENS